MKKIEERIDRVHQYSLWGNRIVIRLIKSFLERSAPSGWTRPVGILEKALRIKAGQTIVIIVNLCNN